MQERIVTEALTQWLNVTRDAFGVALEATTKAQEQTLKFFDDLAKRGTVAQEESKRFIEDWVQSSRQSLEVFQRQAQESLKRWEETVPKGVTAMTLVTKQDVEELAKKIEELVKKVEALSR